MRVYFDSGATISILSHKMADLYDIPFTPCNIQIKTANNHVATPLGITDQLSVDVYGHVCLCTF
jgi:hypothetical protein